MSNSRLIFRAWNKKEKRMYSPEEIDQMNLFNLITDEDTWDIMQFTGVCDKNGFLIFEKDIVEYKIPSCPTISKELVFFADGAFLKDGHAISSYRNKTILAGNIYENPELISVTMKETLKSLEMPEDE